MLTDILKPRVVELGSIRIGKKGEKKTSAKGNEFRLPVKLDHFLITKLTRDDNDDLKLDTALMESLVEAGHGDADGAIRSIPIRVLSNDPEEIMQASYCWYVKKKLGAKSDGKTITFYIGATQKDWLQPLPEPITKPFVPEMLDWKDGDGNKMLKIHAVFNCVIASKSARFGGVYKFRTTSGITASQLLGGLTHIMELTNGILVNMPLQLAIRPLQVSPESMGGKTTKVYIVHVELVGDDLRALQQQAIDQARWMLESTGTAKHILSAYRKVLRTPGDEIDPAEIADIQEEWHPEGSDGPKGTDFPMPKAKEEEPPQVETPQVEPSDEPKPPAEDNTTEAEKPKGKRGRKKKEPEAAEVVETPAPEKPEPETPKPVVEEKKPVEPEKPAATLTPQQLADKWKKAIDDIKTLPELQELKQTGNPFAEFWLSLSEKNATLATDLANYAKAKKLQLLRNAIEDEWQSGDWDDKKIKALAKSIGINDIHAMDTIQAEKLLGEMQNPSK